MVKGAHEVIVGAVTDPSFGKLVAFGLGGVLVEVLKDVTFRLAPTPRAEALSMINGIGAAEILRGVRGAAAADHEALASLICSVSQLVDEFPEISEVDLNPVFAGKDGAVAADVRIIVDFNPPAPRFRPSQAEIVTAMNRIMRPDAVAVIGASAEDGKIGNSVMRNLIDGGYQGAIYPIHPRLDEVLGKKAYPSVKDIAGPRGHRGVRDSRARGGRRAGRMRRETGRRRDPDSVGLRGDRQPGPAGRSRGGGAQVQHPPDGPEHLRLLLHAQEPLRDLLHALRRQGQGRAVIAKRRRRDGDRRLQPLDQDGRVGDRRAGQQIGHRRGRPAATSSSRTTPRRRSRCTSRTSRMAAPLPQAAAPGVEEQAGRSRSRRAAPRWARAPRARIPRRWPATTRFTKTCCAQSGVVRARSLNDMLEFARCLPILPTPKGENVLIVTGAGGSGVLLADACTDWDLQLMAMPPDLDAAFRKFIPPFGAAGNPVDITGGEPPTTYRNTIALGLEDARIHALILGYWHTIITPPMVFAKLVSEVVEEFRAKGINKPVVASLVGDVEVEEASRYLFDHDIPAYPYTTEKPVAVLGAKYQWARRAGLL